LKRILVPCDFSKHARKALENASSIARQFGAEVILANVIEPMAYPAEAAFFPIEFYGPQRQEENLAELKTLGAELGLKTKPIVRIGSPWEELVKIAEEEDVDLIVITTHGRTGFSHVLIGSVAERIVQHAPCPVLTVRIPAEALKKRKQRRKEAQRF
jgi:nucleotide-binding universal stress UspA family protein